MEEQTEEHKTTSLGKTLTGLGYALCVILAAVFIINMTMIVKSYMHPDRVPDFAGYKPFIVLSGSMEPAIMAGDLIVTKNIAPENVAVGDVISFRVENDIMVSHRVTEIQTAGGLSFLTKGDANIGMDAVNVRPETIEGLYIWRGAGLGKFAIFLQTPIGMLIFVITPLCLFIIYDIVSRGRRSKKKSAREAALEAELAALKSGQDVSKQ
ncbi:MAG: signal peptidase I [Peptococcaceae bacterium]|nr:signal peptidase I [Candidatus Syntrophopropionicum ammoniitolerans]